MKKSRGCQDRWDRRYCMEGGALVKFGWHLEGGWLNRVASRPDCWVMGRRHGWGQCLLQCGTYRRRGRKTARDTGVVVDTDKGAWQVWLLQYPLRHAVRRGETVGVQVLGHVSNFFREYPCSTTKRHFAWKGKVDHGRWVSLTAGESPAHSFMDGSCVRGGRHERCSSPLVCVALSSTANMGVLRKRGGVGGMGPEVRQRRSQVMCPVPCDPGDGLEQGGG